MARQETEEPLNKEKEKKEEKSRILKLRFALARRRGFWPQKAFALEKNRGGVWVRGKERPRHGQYGGRDSLIRKRTERRFSRVLPVEVEAINAVRHGGESEKKMRQAKNKKRKVHP